MRKIFCCGIFFLTLLVLGAAARAQTFGSGVILAGSTNVPCLNGTTPITNFFYVQVPSKNITLTGITSTNETFVASFYLSLPNYTNSALGLTNLYFLSAVTNSFASGTNNGSWTTNTPAAYVTIPFPLIMGASVGNFTNSIYVP